MPAEDALRGWFARGLRLVTRQEYKPTIADDALRQATNSTLDDVVAPPACGPLLRELDNTFTQPHPAALPNNRLRLVVLPPGDQTNIVEVWASRNGHQIVPPPDRRTILQRQPEIDLNSREDQILVVSDLDRWFLRHHHGLELIRRLLSAIDRCERQCLIACSSWAWAFLRKAIDADATLPVGVTFKAFDGQRLQTWFSDLAKQDDAHPIEFKLAKSGKTVLTTKDEQVSRDYFDRLAAHSLGIPWVAWRIWRQSLRVRNEHDANHTEMKTLWLEEFEPLKLPLHHRPAALLLLQALLIHGSLTLDQLQLVLPMEGECHLISVLIRGGFVVRDGDQLRCSPVAYPAIRGDLASAGFPLDEL